MICIYECIITVSRISLTLSLCLLFSCSLSPFQSPAMHHASHSISLLRSLSLTLSLSLSVSIHVMHLPLLRSLSLTLTLTLWRGRALHHGHQLLDQHALGMPLAELLQMLILIGEALD